MSSLKPEPAPKPAASFLVAPWIEVGSILEWSRDAPTEALLQRNQLTPAIFLRNFLDALQPRDTDNGIQLGYMIGINVYDLFRPNASGDWEFDEARVGFFTDLFREVARPVVVNLRANHFIGDNPLFSELAADDTSFARTNEGSPICETYYLNPVFAPTFALDESIRLNQFRFGGFRRLAASLAEFDRRCPDTIRAFTLAGEIHHFLPGLANATAAGRFENAAMTDYSETSICEFRSWLKARHDTVCALNQRFGTPFSAWADVQPPGRDLRSDPGWPSWMHMDSYAGGYVPVFGWAELSSGETIGVYLDGEFAGEAQYGLSRLDVYEALDDLSGSNIGFRFDIDYRGLPAGPHLIHVVVVQSCGQRLLLGRRPVVVGQAAAAETSAPALPSLDDLPALADSGRRGWLDHPPGGLTLLFNPYAAEWQEFREWQVQALLVKFAEIAIDAGLPREKLYSHQIMPEFEGSWNRVAFAVSGQPAETDLFAPGIDLYGGATLYPGLETWLAGRRYGVPEFHPRMGRLASRDVFRRGLEYHRRLGASFVCPYFMALREPHGATANPVDALLIHLLNPHFGSLFFYTALAEFLNQRR